MDETPKEYWERYEKMTLEEKKKIRSKHWASATQDALEENKIKPSEKNEICDAIELYFKNRIYITEEDKKHLKLSVDAILGREINDELFWECFDETIKQRMITKHEVTSISYHLSSRRWL